MGMVTIKIFLGLNESFVYFVIMITQVGIFRNRDKITYLRCQHNINRKSEARFLKTGIIIRNIDAKNITCTQNFYQHILYHLGRPNNFVNFRGYK